MISSANDSERRSVKRELQFSAEIGVVFRGVSICRSTNAGGPTAAPKSLSMQEADFCGPKMFPDVSGEGPLLLVAVGLTQNRSQCSTALWSSWPQSGFNSLEQSL